MKILFISLNDFESISERGIYTDLLREFVKHGHDVKAISPTEKNTNDGVRLIYSNGVEILKFRIESIQKTNLIRKGLSTLLIERDLAKTIREYYINDKFDLVLFTTPPITFLKAIKYLKHRDNAVCYLLLKDIFPQNALDLGFLVRKGIKGLIYEYFRRIEKQLYEVSDFIGCMTEANVEYILKNNRFIESNRVEVCPNSIEINEHNYDRDQIRRGLIRQLSLNEETVIFVYGGNLGKPQGIDFLLKCILQNENRENAHFIVVGSGTEFSTIKSFFAKNRIRKSTLLEQKNKEEFSKLLVACDVGLVFLDYRFTIPNFPSRILSYMEFGLPILAATDNSTDLKDKILQGNFGLWCRSNDIMDFDKQVVEMQSLKNRILFGTNSRRYLLKNYDVRYSYEKIMSHFGVDNLEEHNDELFNQSFP